MLVEPVRLLKLLSAHFWQANMSKYVNKLYLSIDKSQKSENQYSVFSCESKCIIFLYNYIGSCTVRWENKTMYCIVSVFGLSI